jgi:hypothetical protein
MARSARRSSDQLKRDSDKLLNETRRELETSMKRFRKDIVHSPRNIVAPSIGKDREAAGKEQRLRIRTSRFGWERVYLDSHNTLVLWIKCASLETEAIADFSLIR